MERDSKCVIGVELLGSLWSKERQQIDRMESDMGEVCVS